MDNRHIVDNRLAHMDQVSFLGVRALGYGTLAQVVWLYNRPVDIDALRRFHRNLGHGLLGRRIERSPLPFARDRWVLSRGPADIEIAPTPLPRREVNAWAYERACLPIDPEFGPGWHLGVVPVQDGGAAISLVTSHTLVDGLGVVEVIADAVEGRTRDLGYPVPGSRTRRRAVLEDARLTLASVPELARALAAGLRLARQGRREFASSIAGAPPAPRTARDDRPVVVPTLVAYVDLAQWDACAARLGGTSNSLFAGFAATLGARMGRHAGDGTVALAFPVGQRVAGDTRANAMTFANITVDPARAASDLAEIRGKLKQVLTERAEHAYELLAPLPLAALTPMWAARRLVGVGLGTSALPVGCSNLGPLDPAVVRPDGADADYAYGRLIEPGISKRALDGMGGQLFVASGRTPGKVFISVVAYRPGRQNSPEALRELVSQAFAEFGLTAEIDG
ncbi:hypothetical protein [Mycobacterium camsae]|uniref:hypothetical protein n=1 Tax=Mycobacterium gordonae TaxID=1778 RepID=UPI001F11D1B0|nr:hypothetical protein [Mycobacterium gordonae]